MWLMILSGLGMTIVALLRYYKENKTGINNGIPDLLPGKEQNNVSQEKTAISTIHTELVPPKID